MISDGTLTETGRWRGWRCFCQHPLAHVFLEPYRLGDSDDEGEHRLLVDRYLGTSMSGSSATSSSSWPLSRRSFTRLSAGETEALYSDCQTCRARASGPRARSSCTPSRVPSGSGNKSCSTADCAVGSRANGAVRSAPAAAEPGCRGRRW